MHMWGYVCRFRGHARSRCGWSDSGGCSLVNTGDDKKGVLNENCGADFVQKAKKHPLNVAGAQERRLCRQRLRVPSRLGAP